MSTTATTTNATWIDQVYVGNNRLSASDPLKVRLARSQQVRDLGSIGEVLNNYRALLKREAAANEGPLDSVEKLNQQLHQERIKTQAWQSEVKRLEGVISDLRDQQDAGAAARGLKLAQELEHARTENAELRRTIEGNGKTVRLLTDEAVGLRAELEKEKAYGATITERASQLQELLDELREVNRKILEENETLKNSSVNFSAAHAEVSAVEIATLKSQLSALTQQMAAVHAAFPWLHKVTAP